MSSRQLIHVRIPGPFFRDRLSSTTLELGSKPLYVAATVQDFWRHALHERAAGSVTVRAVMLNCIA